MKRQRGRGRGGKPGGGHHNHQNPNRSMESSGPEGTKVRGPAALVYERYLQYARDAASAGDRVLSENYLQHADHYFRLLRAMQPAMPVQPQADRFGGEIEEEGEEETAAAEGEAVEAGGEDEQPDVEFPQQGGAQQASGQQGERNFDREGGDFRRRRGRRRFRPEGGEPQAEGGERREPREAREPREPREARAPREERGEGAGRDQAGPEGFSSGPKPAFLRSE